MTLTEIWSLLFKAPPSPPDELVQARRETLRDAARARRAAREFQQAVHQQDNILARIGDVSRLIHTDGDGR